MHNPTHTLTRHFVYQAPVNKAPAGHDTCQTRHLSKGHLSNEAPVEQGTCRTGHLSNRPPVRHGTYQQGTCLQGLLPDPDGVPILPLRKAFDKGRCEHIQGLSHNCPAAVRLADTQQRHEHLHSNGQECQPRICSLPSVLLCIARVCKTFSICTLFTHCSLTPAKLF